MKHTLLIILVIFLTSCCKEDTIGIQKDAKGNIISLPYKWKKPLHATGRFTSNSRIKKPIYYKNNIAIATTNGDNNRFLTMVNSENGETVWQWDDRFYKEKKNILI